MTKLLDTIAMIGLWLAAIVMLSIGVGLMVVAVLHADGYIIGFFAFIIFTVWCAIRADSIEYYLRNKK